MWQLTLLTLAHSLTCPTITCNTTPTTGECFSTASGVSITPCATGYECAISSLSDASAKCELEYAPKSAYPGEFCGSAQDCFSGKCVNSVCQGSKVDEDCENAYDCGQGLYCNMDTKKCAAQIAVGATCTDNYACVNSALCGASGRCVTYFSQNNGQNTNNVDDSGFAWLCSSGYATGAPGSQRCAAAPTSAGTLPVACEADTDCTATGGAVTGTCVCNYGTGSPMKSYCNPFIGDKPYTDLIAAYQALLTKNGNCSTARRFDYKCFATSDQATQALFYTLGELRAQLDKGYYSLFQGDDQAACIPKVVTYEYQQIQNAKEKYTVQECPRYVCDVQSTEFANGQCGFHDMRIEDFLVEEELLLKPCATGDCTFPRIANTTCSIPEVAKSYPGDYCQVNANCTSTSCDLRSGRCMGKKLNEPCFNEFDCEEMLYCSPATLKCESQLTPGSTCSSDYQCANHAFCDSGKCVQYFSLNKGSPTARVSGQNYGYAPACKSGFGQFSEANQQFECQDAPVSAGQVGAECTLGTPCKDSTGNYEKPCVCGTNSEGKAYCMPFEGDQYLQNAIKSLPSLFQLNSECNTYSRFSENCYLGYEHQEIEREFYFYATNITMYENLPYIQNTPSCAQTMFDADYYDYLDKRDNPPTPPAPAGDYDDDDDFANWLLAGVGLVLVIQ